MAIVDLQRGIAEAGRIRIGQKVASKNGTRPAKLDTFRLTSADRRRIEQAADVYGGAVTEWDAPAGKQWQVITERDSLDVIVPPSDLSFSQHYELWSAGGCQRRCDGVNEQLSQGPCRCDPERRECDIHTRLSVMLTDLRGLGVWRLDTQGYYAAVELRGAVEILAIAGGHGSLLPARLRLEQRSAKRKDAEGKVETRRYAVPVLDIEVSPAQLLAGGGAPIRLEQAARPPLTPVPQLESSDAPSIAEQSAPPAARPPRANAAPEIPASGRTRRAGAQGHPEFGGQPIGNDIEQTLRDDAAADEQSRPERSPIDVMVDLVRAAGKDPDAIRDQLGYATWEAAPDDVVARLTAKARDALMEKAEAIATEPASPARRSRSKKAAEPAAVEA